jgi:arylsulfatase A-like enzyme
MEKKNLIIITLDGLRVDRLEYAPYFKSLFDSNLSFENMITAAPYTFASMHAIFSSMYPSTNGVNAYYNMFKFKKEQIKTLAQYFKELEYQTYAQVLNDCVLPSQGVDKIEVHKIGDDQIELHKNRITELSEEGPFYGYFQYTNIHDQTVINSKEYTDEDEGYFGEEAKKRNTQKFIEITKETDLYVKEIMDHLKALNILDDTIVIFHADHGTSEGEKKGEKLYGAFVYDYTIRTFCTIINPNIDKKVHATQCRTIDLMPTILEIYGLEIDNKYNAIQGKSLYKNFTEEKVAFTETGGLFGPWPSRKEHNVFSVRKMNRKIIYNKTPDTWEFYNLEDDKEEVINLIDKDKEEVSEYKALFKQIAKDNNIIL